MHSLYVDGARYEKIHQDIKFQFVLSQLGEKDSLLDVVSGLGHLAEYCWGGGWKGSYTGLDISREMVKVTKMRLGTNNIFNKDILEDYYNKKHDVVA